MAFQFFRVALLLIALQTFAVADDEFDSDPDVRWENFKKSYRKTYEPGMESMKRKNFETNYQKITTHNQGNRTFHLGSNEFADMIIEEFLEFFTGLIMRTSEAPIAYVAPADADVPDSVDWRNASAVTPVKNQGQCGSCYAFSATGALEGQTKLKIGTLVSLSEQNIIDCSMLQGNMGCGGGDMDAAFEYIMKNNGIDSEKSYPYREKESFCRYKRRNRAATCSGYSDITPRGDEDILKTAVATVGPISVGIDASHDSFQLYKGGIYDEPQCSSTELDHGVLLVGYGSENGMDYWIIKNSWGSSWGEDGYMRMSRNKNNQCGIATQASFPVV